jgi:hypothetical protein
MWRQKRIKTHKKFSSKKFLKNQRSMLSEVDSPERFEKTIEYWQKEIHATYKNLLKLLKTKSKEIKLTTTTKTILPISFDSSDLCKISFDAKLFLELAESTYKLFMNLVSSGQTFLALMDSELEVDENTKNVSENFEHFARLFQELLKFYSNIWSIYSEQSIKELFQNKSRKLGIVLEKIRDVKIKMLLLNFRTLLTSPSSYQFFLEFTCTSLPIPYLGSMSSGFWFLGILLQFDMKFQKEKEISLTGTLTELFEKKKSLLHQVESWFIPFKIQKVISPIHFSSLRESLDCISHAIPECDLCCVPICCPGEIKLKSFFKGEEQEKENKKIVWNALYTSELETLNVSISAYRIEDCKIVKEVDYHFFHRECLANALDAQADQAKIARTAHNPRCPHCNVLISRLCLYSFKV